MAYLRRVRTTSGATAVQIAEYCGGREQVVEHVGSAHTEAELGVLVERGRELLANRGQGVLDFEVDPSYRVVHLVPAPCGVLVEAPPVPGGHDGAGRVVGTASRVLFDALGAVFGDLGFDAVGDQVFADLVVARIVEPTSLADTARVLADLGCEVPSYSTMARTLRRAQARGYRDQVAAACFAHSLACKDVSLVLYDVTTLYFEAEKEDGLRKVGYSKERRVDPQILVGLLVDRGGFPLEIGCFPGNHAETKTVVPIVKQFAARHHLDHMVVVADAGMLSKKNLEELDEAGLCFVVGSKATKSPIDLASHFRWHGEAFTDGQVIDTITPKDSRVRDNDVNVKAEPVWDPSVHTGSWRAVWAYSRKRWVRDNKTLNIQEERARDVVEGTKTAKTTRFVTTSKGQRKVDTTSLARARRAAGLKGYVTNITAATMPAAEVVAAYHDLWHVEQSFRMSKTDLAARPMFARRREAIEAHLTIAFTALAVAREAQDRTGLAIGNLVRQLRPLRSATIAINGTTQTLPPALDPERQAILNALTHPLNQPDQ